MILTVFVKQLFRRRAVFQTSARPRECLTRRAPRLPSRWTWSGRRLWPENFRPSFASRSRSEKSCNSSTGRKKSFTNYIQKSGWLLRTKNNYEFGAFQFNSGKWQRGLIILKDSVLFLKPAKLQKKLKHKRPQPSQTYTTHTLIYIPCMSMKYFFIKYFFFLILYLADFGMYLTLLFYLFQLI